MKKVIAALSALLIFAGSGIRIMADGEPETACVNHAPEARMIRSSSEYSSEYQSKFAADGVIRRQEMRLPNWMTNDQREGTLTLTWEEPQTLTRALFYDIGDLNSQVEKVTMTFDDGTVLEMGALVNNGSPKGLDFEEPVTAGSVEIHVTGTANTQAVGLSEVEFFNADGINVAPLAEAEADSEARDGSPYWFIPVTYEGWYAAENAVNGWADFTLPKKTVEDEWASLGESAPSITFTWEEPVRIGTVVLMDRVSSDDWVLGGEITFDSGETVTFGELDNYGDPYYADIPDVTAQSMTVHVTESAGPNLGFAEIEVYTEHFDEDGNPIPAEDADAPSDGADPGLPDDAPETADGAAQPESSDLPDQQTSSALPNVGPTSIVILILFAALLSAAGISALGMRRAKRERIN